MPEFYRLPKVMQITGVSRKTIYRWMEDKTMNFPRQIKLGARCVVWNKLHVEKWIKAQTKLNQLAY